MKQRKQLFPHLTVRSRCENQIVSFRELWLTSETHTFCPTQKDVRGWGFWNKLTIWCVWTQQKFKLRNLELIAQVKSISFYSCWCYFNETKFAYYIRSIYSSTAYNRHPYKIVDELEPISTSHQVSIISDLIKFKGLNYKSNPENNGAIYVMFCG